MKELTTTHLAAEEDEISESHCEERKELPRRYSPGMMVDEEVQTEEEEDEDDLEEEEEEELIDGEYDNEDFVSVDQSLAGNNK